MNNTKIYLFVSGEGWKEFELANSSELAKRNIVIGDGAEIGDGAKIGDGAEIGYGAEIGDGAKPKTLFITGSNHAVMYCGQDIIQIGCIQKSISDWKNEYTNVGSKHNYTEKQIEEYSWYIEMVAAFHEKTKEVF